MNEDQMLRHQALQTALEMARANGTVGDTDAVLALSDRIYAHLKGEKAAEPRHESETAKG